MNTITLRRDTEPKWGIPPRGNNWIVRRGTTAEYENMIMLWKWCEEMFGKQEYDETTWCTHFTNSDNDDEVTFVFYDEGMATLFALRWA